MQEQAHVLKHDEHGAAAVLKALAHLPVHQASEPPTAGEARETALHYLTKRLNQIQYATFQAQGLPIGSGSVESANKLVVEVRLKGSGMHWARQHVNPLVALRTIACADRWAEAWPQIELHLRDQMRYLRAQRQRGHRTAHPPSCPSHVPAPGARKPSKTPCLAARAQPPRIVNGRPTSNHPWKKRPLLAGGRRGLAPSQNSDAHPGQQIRLISHILGRTIDTASQGSEGYRAVADGSDSTTGAVSAELTADIRIFLIAELRDYTRFSHKRGDEEAARLVERFAILARQVVDAYGGTVIELRGDEALAVFGAARQALRAAVELQARYVEETQRDPSLPLRVGVGLDAGEAIPFEGGYRGRALNLAARLKDVARAGQVLATEALIHLAGQTDGLRYVERGLVNAKGYPVPVHVVQVVPEGQQLADVEHSAEPELRTFLFVDIGGYSAFIANHGDAAGAELQTLYAEIVEERVHARDGRLLELAGDSAFVVFVSPRQALRAAMELRDQFQQVMEQERQFPITLSIGVEAGEAIPMRGKYTGGAVNLAAKICALAGPGEVLIGETIAQLVRKFDGLRLVDRGHQQISGYSDPVHIMQVVREDAVMATGSVFAWLSSVELEAPG